MMNYIPVLTITLYFPAVTHRNDIWLATLRSAPSARTNLQELGDRRAAQFCKQYQEPADDTDEGILHDAQRLKT